MLTRHAMGSDRSGKAKEEHDRCREQLGNGMRCEGRKNHNGLHHARLPDGRLFEWG